MLMLKQLSVDNFKSWKRIDKMRLAPITGLFGTNSSGKTSILQLFLMLKQTIESSDRAQVFLMVWSRDQGYRKQRYPAIGAYDRYSAKNL
jgi:AAA15 family ATPase/GTPase